MCNNSSNNNNNNIIINDSSDDENMMLEKINENFPAFVASLYDPCREGGENFGNNFEKYD